MLPAPELYDSFCILARTPDFSRPRQAVVDAVWSRQLLFPPPVPSLFRLPPGLKKLTAGKDSIKANTQTRLTGPCIISHDTTPHTRVHAYLRTTH